MSCAASLEGVRSVLIVKTSSLGDVVHTLPSVRQAVELIQSGAIGTVQECHSWVSSSRGMPDSIVESPPVQAQLQDKDSQ